VNNHSKIGIVLAGHGSREKEAILQFQEMAALLSSSQKGILKCGYLEFEPPAIGESIDRAILKGARAVIVLPAMLNAAHHVKRDIPIIIEEAKKRHPEIPIYYGKHLDLHPKIVALYQMRIREALSTEPASSEKETLLIIAGRGTSDLAANEDVLKLKRLVQEGSSFGTILHSYTSIAAPLLPEALDAARQLPYRTILIAPYLLFKGVLAGKVASYAEQFRKNNQDRCVIVSQTLGPTLLARDAFLDRFNEARWLLENEQDANSHQEEGKDTA
jgi:sirohydrochlorin ferrochelatase